MKPDSRSQEGAGQPSDELFRMVARRRESALEPQRIGASFFFEVRGGWEVRALLDDVNVRKVYTVSGLEDAFHDQTVRTILIPRDSHVSQNVAIRVCGRHGQGKTVFFAIKAEE